MRIQKRMSNEWQHKIYNQEATPPARTWDKISAALDESHVSDSFPHILYNAEAQPPAGTWEAIANTLAEEEISNEFPSTLYNAEAIPPANTWEHIAAALDGQKKEQFASTLYNMEATPPAAAWKNIVAALDEKPRRVIPLFIRYAAAAVLVGVIAFAAFRLINNSSDKETDGPVAGVDKVVNPPVSSTDDQHQSNEPSKETNITDHTIESSATRDDRALEESKGTMANLNMSEKAKIAHLTSQYVAADAPVSTISAAEDLAPQSTYRDIECSEVSRTGFFASFSPSIDMATRYIMFKTPDGRTVRISKKLGDLVCCVSGDEVDENCENQLDKWRRKIANAPVTPSPGNFMDILDLVSTLKDNSL
jgi:hypothetical protein